MLVALANLYPQPAFRRTLLWLIDDFVISPETFEAQLAYMVQRGWIETRTVQIIGRSDLRIVLTADGYDIAQGIDPENPVCD
ncbi:hypothetical protein GC173_11555 [bacterium]|nr:hypothetical protein [bacterium]